MDRTFSRLIHVIAHISTLLLLWLSEHSLVKTFHILFSHSLIDGHQRRFCFLAIMNNTLNKILCKLMFLILSGTIIGVEFLGPSLPIPTVLSRESTT